MIDERLLGNRNRVSHGRRLEIQVGDYISLHETIVELVDQFRTDIENAAALFKYRRSPSTTLQ